mgnify:CR=1 FL=1
MERETTRKVMTSLRSYLHITKQECTKQSYNGVAIFETITIFLQESQFTWFTYFPKDYKLNIIHFGMHTFFEANACRIAGKAR